MGTDAFITALRMFTRQKPFQPFVLEFTSGATVQIRHPEAILIQGNLIIFRDQDSYYSVFDSTGVARFFQSGPTPPPPSQPPTENAS